MLCLGFSSFCCADLPFLRISCVKDNIVPEVDIYCPSRFILRKKSVFFYNICKKIQKNQFFSLKISFFCIIYKRLLYCVKNR